MVLLLSGLGILKVHYTSFVDQEVVSWKVLAPRPHGMPSALPLAVREQELKRPTEEASNDKTVIALTSVAKAPGESQNS